jgi:hypothetical protein
MQPGRNRAEPQCYLPLDEPVEFARAGPCGSLLPLRTCRCGVQKSSGAARSDARGVRIGCKQHFGLDAERLLARRAVGAAVLSGFGPKAPRQRRRGILTGRCQCRPLEGWCDMMRQLRRGAAEGGNPDQGSPAVRTKWCGPRRCEGPGGSLPIQQGQDALPASRGGSGQPAIIAHALEALGQHMLEKAPDKL